MPIPSSDIDFILSDRDTSVEVVAGSPEITGRGILDLPQQIVQDGYVITTEWTVLVKAAEFGGLIYGDAIRCDGINFFVRESRVMGDGVIAQLLLEKLAPDSTAPGRHPTQQFGLDDLTDVQLTDAEEGDILVRSTENWVNVDEVDGGGP